MSASEAKDPLIGTVFADRYRIIRRLGAGGMGCVYAANQLSMDREVALKVLNPELGESATATQRFVREMQASSKVEHPNTIRVYDFGESADGRLFLAMELLAGHTLHRVLRDSGALETSRLIRIGDQVARALSAAHAEGIVHRDLKPENVMLMDRYGERDQVRVLDFGIARLAESGGQGDEPVLTKAGTLIGTPLYMSPEQALGKPVDHRSDLYALGVLLYQMATGQVPFSADTPVRVLFMHAHDAPKPPSRIVAGRVPARLEALILSLLEKDPNQRPQSATEVISALRRVTEGQTIEEPAGQLHAASRLSDPSAMARARAAHADPASRVPTSQSVTVDPAADPMMQTLIQPEAGQVQQMTVDVDGPSTDAGAMTIATDQSLLESAETGVISRAVVDTGAMTMESQPPRMTPGPGVVAHVTTSDVLDDATAPANPVVTRPAAPTPAEAPVAKATPTPSAPPSGTPASSATPSSTPAASTPAPVDNEEGGGGGKTGLIIAALAVVALVAVAVVMSSGSEDAPVGGSQPATVSAPAADKAATETQKPAEDKPAPAAATDALRKALRDARTAAGDPVTPEGCRVTDAKALEALIAATKGLAGGRPRGKRTADLEAVKGLEALTGDVANAAEVQATLARARLLAGASDPAIIEAANKATGSCPKLALAWEVEGVVHLLGMRPKVAKERLTKAVALAPGFTRARYNLGLAQLGSGEPAVALATFEEVRAKEPKRKGIWVGIGQAHLAAKAPPKAIEALTRATTLEPENAAAWYLLGVAQQAASDKGAAQTAWCKAAKLGHGRAARKCPEAAGIPVPK